MMRPVIGKTITRLMQIYMRERDKCDKMKDKLICTSSMRNRDNRHFVDISVYVCVCVCIARQVDQGYSLTVEYWYFYIC